MIIYGVEINSIVLSIYNIFQISKKKKTEFCRSIEFEFFFQPL